MENSSNDKGLGLPATPSGSPLQVLAEDGSGLFALIPKPPAHRPIKFRMWSGTKMFYDIANVMECLMQQMGIWQNASGLISYDHVKEHGSVFMQFTGLFDKDGREIYEGDWLGGYPHGSALVVWDDKHACYAAQWEEQDWDDDGEAITRTLSSLLATELDQCGDKWTVIGNLYEGDGSVIIDDEKH